MSIGLLDLPQEIQDNVYSHYFEATHVEAYYDAKRISRRQTEIGTTVDDRLFFVTRPDLNVYLVCHKVYQDARRALNTVQDQTLVVKNMGWNPDDFESLLNAERYPRLHANTTHIQFEHFTCHTPTFWYRFLETFRKVQTLDLAIKTTSSGQIFIELLQERISNDSCQREAERFVRFGAVTIAEFLHKRWGEKCSVTATSTCTWHPVGNSGSLRCQLMYDVRVDGCHLIKKSIDT